MTTSLHIAIVGAGAAGLSCAYALKKHHLTVFDPCGFPSRNASFIAGGMLAPYAEIEHMNGDWVKAGLDGIDFWKKFSALHNIDFGQRGSYLVAHQEDQYILDRFRSHLPEDAGAYKCCNEIEPALKERFAEGLFIPTEAHLHPAKAMAALIDECKEAHFKAETVDPHSISDEFDFVIDARGLGSDDPSLRGVKGEIALVHNPDFSLSRPIRLMHPRYPLYIVPRAGNIFMIGATQIESEDGKHVTLRSTLELLSALYSLHPSFGEAHILETLVGLRPAYPDNLPRVRQSKNIISANGMFRHGWLLAPVVAQCIAALAEGRDNRYISLFIGETCETDHQRTGTHIRSAA